MLNLTLSETIRALNNGQSLPNSHILAILENLQDQGAEKIQELKDTITELEEKLWLIEDDEKTEKLLQELCDDGAEYCGQYGEQGYTNPKKFIILHNWNNVEQKIQDYFEAIGCELEWNDEWIIDHENDKAYRTSANGYDWQSQIAHTESGELLTPDSSIEDWIDFCKVEQGDNVTNCLRYFTSDSDIESLGYIKYNENSFESGWHAGQTDDPQKIAKQIFDNVENCESVVFKLDENSQFYSKFSAFYKLQDIDA